MFHCRQVDRDCDFLEQERIMDYSLLVGLHFREAAADGQASGLRTPTGYFASFSEIVFLVIKLEQVN